MTSRSPGAKQFSWIAGECGAFYDERMVRFVPLVFLLQGCMLFSGGDPSYVGDVPEELRRQEIHVPEVYDFHPYGDVTVLRTGDWCTYQVGEVTLTLAVTGKDADGTWVEVIEEEDPRTVSARWVGPDGFVQRALYRVLPEERVHPQQLAQAPVEAEAEYETIEVKPKPTTLEFEGQSFPGTLVTEVREDWDGRRSIIKSWWSKEVPRVFDGSEHGGLVRQEGVQLLRFGRDAKPLVPRPIE